MLKQPGLNYSVLYDVVYVWSQYNGVSIDVWGGFQPGSVKM